MKYTVEKPPEWMSGMPKAAMRLGLAVFNAAQAKGRSDAEAKKAAMAAMAERYEQIAGGWREKKQPEAAARQEVLQFRAGQAVDESGMLWEAVLIAPGLSKSYPAFYWSDELLEMAVEKFAGVDINAYELTADYFQHLSIPGIERLEDVKRYLTANKCGTVEKVWHEPGAGVKANIRFIPEQAWLPRTLAQGKSQGNQNVLGLSIDSRIKGFEVLVDGDRVIWVTEIVNVSSVDVVTRPAAGGEFIRAIQGQQKEEGMKKKLWAMILQARPALLDGKDVEKMTDAEVEVLAQQAMAPAATDQGKEEQLRAAQSAGLKTEDVQKLVDAGIKAVEQRAACGIMLDSKLASCQLPENAKARVKESLAGQTFDEAAVTAAIKKEGDYLAAMGAPGLDLGDQSRVRVGLGSLGKIQIAVDKAFGLTKEHALAAVKAEDLHGHPLNGDLRAAQAADYFDDAPRLGSLRELYLMLGGDADGNGQFDRRNLPADLRAAQEINSSTFANVMANAMGRRLARDYRETDYREGMLVSTAKPVKDFRTQEAINIGFFGDLSDVDPETGDYTEIQEPGDEQSPYAIGTKGNILTITRKTIINDDLALIVRMIQRLGRAARRTHAQYIWNFYINNSNCSDGTAWFTGGHGNLGAAALSFSTAITAYEALAKMTEKDSGKRIGWLDNPTVKPVLVYPVDLMAIGESIVNDDDYYTANDLTTKTRNPLKGKISGAQVSLLTDATDWGLLMPPSEGDMIEMGYLNGRQEPEMFVADGPTAEWMFKSDKIKHKIRHEYAGAVVDFRTGYKAVVAG